MADSNNASAARAEGARARLRYVRDVWFDVYAGTMADLVDSGVATADMFPGQPGRRLTSAAYYGGAPVPQGGHPKHDEQYLQIQRSGPHRFVVRVGLRADEGSRRLDARLAERGRRCEASGRAALAAKLAAPAGNPMDRNGRLLAGSIIKPVNRDGPLTRRMLERMIAAENADERWRYVVALSNPQSTLEEKVLRDMRLATSEVEAWVLIERVRKAVRHG